MPRSAASFFLFVFATLFISCENDPLKSVDVSNIAIPFQVFRFDRDFRSADFSDPVAASQQLYQKYGSFYCSYVEQVMQIGPCFPDSAYTEIARFLTDPGVSEEYAEIQRICTDESLAPYNKTFEDGLRHWHYYFPEEPVPSVIYAHTNYRLAVGSSDSLIVVGLEYYLGPQDPMVQRLPPDLFPNYRKEDMDPHFMVSDALRDFIYYHAARWNPPPTTEQTLLDLMTYNGKCYYLLDALLPEVPDSIKMNWSKAQYDWAIANEANTWNVLAHQEVMFQTRQIEISKWMDNGPFTGAENIPQDSPPQLGIWMGHAFVQAYMKEHPETTLKQLMENTDSQTILRSYRPH